MIKSSILHSRTEQQPQQVKAIAPVQRHEAAQIASVELVQVLNLLAQLVGDDWNRPTDCTEWNVRDMAAHLAGGCAGWASLTHFLRQTVLNPHLRRMDVPIDAINRRELEDRVGMTPQQLIDELRQVGPKAIRNRENLPDFIRRIQIDAKPMPGKISVAYLVDVIYPRDQWMHRMDICRATGKTWMSNPDHDRRLLDLVMRDAGQTSAGRCAICVYVSDVSSAAYRFGDSEVQTEIEIDLFTLNRRASGRITAAEALEMVQMNGDEAAAKAFLQSCEVLY